MERRIITTDVLEEDVKIEGSLRPQRLSLIHICTMEAKKKEGLYFVGEVLDLDALTGGFNLQIAWASAHAAAEEILSLIHI